MSKNELNQDDVEDLWNMVSTTVGHLRAGDLKNGYFHLNLLAKMVGILGVRVRELIMYNMIDEFSDKFGLDLKGLSLEDPEDEETYGNYI